MRLTHLIDRKLNLTLEVFQVTREQIVEQTSKAFREHMPLASICLLEEDYASTPKQYGVRDWRRDPQPTEIDVIFGATLIYNNNNLVHHC